MPSCAVSVVFLCFGPRLAVALSSPQLRWPSFCFLHTDAPNKAPLFGESRPEVSTEFTHAQIGWDKWALWEGWGEKTTTCPKGQFPPPPSFFYAMTSPSFRYDFSLWYCLEDDAIATAIREMLDACGFHGYVEHQDHVAGKPVLASVNEIIQSSRLAIVLLTSHSMTDSWCQRILEWNLVHTVHQKGVKVIPVYVDITPEQVPPTLRHLTGLRYSERYFRKRLLDSLKKARGSCCPSTTA